MTRRTNHIQQISPKVFANMIRDDRDDHNWMACHLALQLVGYHDADADKTATAHYTRVALHALYSCDWKAYNDALDELLKLLEGSKKPTENGE